jgi:DNA helicase-2/ATP-dependent DNA helicase PcrA
MDDELFVDGWGSAADAVVGGEATIDSLLAGLTEEERAESQALIVQHDDDLGVIAAAMGHEEPTQPKIPEILSATNYVRVLKGDLTAWDLSRPLPQRPTAAARLGTEVHRIIEERSRGMSTFPEEHELDEPSEVSEPSRVGEMLAKWKTDYGDRTIATLPSGEPMLELPFTLKKDGKIIRGRIDAVYETEDGGLEIVDFKTGKRFTPSEEADQLTLYREALDAIGLAPTSATLTYAFLSAGSDPPSVTAE